MVKKILISILLLYLLIIFQISFIVHFAVKGFVINSIFLLICLLNIIEDPKENYGIIGAGILGFFWDIFSEKFIGYHILILVFLAFLIKVVLVRYVRIKILQRA